MISIKVDSKQLAIAADWLTLQGKQARFAASIALNRTGEEVNAVRQVQLQKVFTIREKNLLTLAAPTRLPAENRATKDRLQVELVHKDYAHVLDPFEEGEPHKQGRGADGRDDPVIIPTRAIRPTQAARVDRALYPINLGLVARRTINPRAEGPYAYALGRKKRGGGVTPFHRTSGSRIQIKGKRGTFVLNELTAPTLDPRKYGVYQRMPSALGTGEVRMLWAFRAVVPRPALLRMGAQASEIVAARFDANFAGAFEFAMRTAR